MINRKAAFIMAADYRTDVKRFRHYVGKYVVRMYSGVTKTGPLLLDELDPDKTFGQVLTDLLGEEPPIRGEREARWRDARAKMMGLKVRETVI